jgi:hypothetical protein
VKVRRKLKILEAEEFMERGTKVEVVDEDCTKYQVWANLCVIQ